MRKIQILTYLGNERKYISNNVKVSSISEPDSFDTYDINIINLNDTSIWNNKGGSKDKCKCSNDLSSIGTIIMNSTKAKNIIILPQNLRFYYGRSLNGYYSISEQLKDMADSIAYMLIVMMEQFKYIKLIFENTTTKLFNNEIKAAFYFAPDGNSTVKTKSENSEKPTTIERNNIVFTTLDLNDYKAIEDFICFIGLDSKTGETAPDWFEGINMFDDEQQYKNITECHEIIDDCNHKIDKSKEKLNKNRYYKSILYTQGDELVETVLDILEEMLGFDFTNFVDEKKADYMFRTETRSYIGEIKGVNHNIKASNVSQLRTHYYNHIETYPDDKDKTEKWLIMNHQRGKNVDDREPVNQEQIEIANKDGSLIIETPVLLKMFEKFKGGELNSSQCLDILNGKIGILKTEDLDV